MNLLLNYLPFPSLPLQQGHVSLNANSNAGRERVNTAAQHVFSSSSNAGLAPNAFPPSLNRFPSITHNPSQQAFYNSPLFSSPSPRIQSLEEQNLRVLLNGLKELLPNEFPIITQNLLEHGMSPKNLMDLIRFLLEKCWKNPDEQKGRQIKDALNLFSRTGYLHLDLTRFSSFPTHVQTMLQLSLPKQGQTLIVSLGNGRYQSFGRFNAFLGKIRGCSYREVILDGPINYQHFFTPANGIIIPGTIERLTICNNDSMESQEIYPGSIKEFPGLKTLSIKNVTNEPPNLLTILDKSPQLTELRVENAPWVRVSSLLESDSVEKKPDLKVNGQDILYWAEGLKCSDADCKEWRKTQLPTALSLQEEILSQKGKALLQKKKTLKEIIEKEAASFQTDAGGGVRMTDDDEIALFANSSSSSASSSSSSSSAYSALQENRPPNVSRKRKRETSLPETSQKKQKLVGLLRPYCTIKTDEFILYNALIKEEQLSEYTTSFLEKAKEAKTVAQLVAAWESSIQNVADEDRTVDTLLRLQKKQETKNASPKKPKTKAVFILANQQTLREKSQFFDAIFSKKFEEKAENVITMKFENLTIRPAMCATILMTHVNSLGPQQIENPEQCFSDLFKAAGYLLLRDFSPLLEFLLFSSQIDSFLDEIQENISQKKQEKSPKKDEIQEKSPKKKENPNPLIPFLEDIKSGIAQWTPTEVSHLKLFPWVLKKLKRDRRNPIKLQLLETICHRFLQALTENSPLVKDLKKKCNDPVPHADINADIMLFIRSMLRLKRKKKIHHRTKENNQETIGLHIKILLKALSENSLHWDFTDFSSFHPDSQDALPPFLPIKGESIALSLQNLQTAHAKPTKISKNRFEELVEEVAKKRYKRVILDGPMLSYPHFQKGKESAKELQELTISNFFPFDSLFEEENRLRFIDLGNVPKFPSLEKLTLKNVTGPRVMIGTSEKNIFRMSPNLKELWLENVPSITLDDLLWAGIIETCPHLKINGKNIFHWPEAFLQDANRCKTWKEEWLPPHLMHAIRANNFELDAITKKLKHYQGAKNECLRLSK